MSATLVSADQFAKRRENLRKILRKKKLPALLVQNEHNVHYLTGFGGEDSILVIGADFEILITDSRFVTQLADECPDLELYVRKTSKGYETMDKSVAAVLNKYNLSSCGFEGDTMTVGFFERIKEQAKNVEMAGTRGWVEELRMIKDKFEIDETRRAVAYAENAFLKVTRALHPDMTENDVAHAIEAVVRRQGGKGHSFEPIVATGPRAALPHGRAGHTKISTAGFILIDWGAMATRYMSDMTRIVRTGKVSPKIEKIYPVVLKAQLAAIAKIRPGAVCGDIDAVARKVIDDAGYGKKFGHGLGHGLGLQVHEQPRFSIGSTQVLEAGMIVTVEPGIYFPGIGGVRIEDDILVTKSGYEVLGSLSKTWEETKVEWAGTRVEWA